MVAGLLADRVLIGGEAMMGEIGALATEEIVDGGTAGVVTGEVMMGTVDDPSPSFKLAVGARLGGIVCTARQSPGPNFAGLAIGHSLTAGNVIWETGHALVKLTSHGDHTAVIKLILSGGTFHLPEGSVGIALTALEADL